VSIPISLVGRIVRASVRYPLVALVSSVVLTALAFAYTTSHFLMTTDTAELISAKQPWRQRELAFETAYPQLQKLTIVVIDGPTPELVDDGATRLASALEQNSALFRNVRRPGGGAFFEREGALFLPLVTVRETTESLARSADMLAPLVADRSLRGVLNPLSGALDRSANKAEALRAMEPEVTALH
jgi:uncharacterized protein